MLIYLYTFESFQTHQDSNIKNKCKLGETGRNANLVNATDIECERLVKKRIAQQKNAGWSEPPVVLGWWKVDCDSNRGIDDLIRDQLLKTGCLDVNYGKEWLIIPFDNDNSKLRSVEIAIDSMSNLNRRNGLTITPANKKIQEEIDKNNQRLKDEAINRHNNQNAIYQQYGDQKIQDEIDKKLKDEAINRRNKQDAIHQHNEYVDQINDMIRDIRNNTLGIDTDYYNKRYSTFVTLLHSQQSANNDVLNNEPIKLFHSSLEGVYSMFQTKVDETIYDETKTKLDQTFIQLLQTHIKSSPIRAKLLKRWFKFSIYQKQKVRDQLYLEWKEEPTDKRGMAEHVFIKYHNKGKNMEDMVDIIQTKTGLSKPGAQTYHTINVIHHGTFDERRELYDYREPILQRIEAYRETTPTPISYTPDPIDIPEHPPVKKNKWLSHLTPWFENTDWFHITLLIISLILFPPTFILNSLSMEHILGSLIGLMFMGGPVLIVYMGITWIISESIKCCFTA